MRSPRLLAPRLLAPRLLAPRLLAPLFLSLALLTPGCAPSAEPAVGRPWPLAHAPIDPARWAAYTARLATRPAPSPLEAEVVEAFAALNRAELAASGASETPTLSDPAFVSAGHRFVHSARRLMDQNTPEAFVDAGRRLAHTLPARLDALVDEAEAAGVSPEDALLAERPGPAAMAFRDLAGPFLAHARSTGLLRADRVAPGHRPLVQALFVHHWISAFDRDQPLHGLLWAEEREWFLRWRVEHQHNGPLDKRLAAAEALRAIEGYPADLNGGLLAASAGRHALADKLLERATQPEAAIARRLLAARRDWLGASPTR